MFKVVSLKKIEPNAKGGFVLTHDLSQGFLWRVEKDRDSYIANPIIYRRKKDAKKHVSKAGTYDRMGKNREQVIQNFIAFCKA